MSNFGLNCDVCNRQNVGVTWVNGMKFCAKCYQETFGASKDWQLLDKDKTIVEQRKQISDLEAKLAESEERLAHCVEFGIWEKTAKERNELKLQLAEKETRIAELEDKDWYEGTIKQLEEQCERLIEEKDNAELQLAEKDEEIEKWKTKWCKSETNSLRLYEQNQNNNQDKISFAIDELVKVKNFVNYRHFDFVPDGLIERFEVEKKIDNQIEELKKEMK